MLPMGSWYTGRAFVPVDKGGQPDDFPLGIMQFPAMDGGACNECKTSNVGASFAINAASKHKELAAGYINAMSTPEMGKRWIETIYLQTADQGGCEVVQRAARGVFHRADGSGRRARITSSAARSIWLWDSARTVSGR